MWKNAAYFDAIRYSLAVLTGEVISRLGHKFAIDCNENNATG